jgi:hypothetical protein
MIEPPWSAAQALRTTSTTWSSVNASNQRSPTWILVGRMSSDSHRIAAEISTELPTLLLRQQRTP